MSVRSRARETSQSLNRIPPVGRIRSMNLTISPQMTSTSARTKVYEKGCPEEEGGEPEMLKVNGLRVGLVAL